MDSLDPGFRTAPKSDPRSVWLPYRCTGCPLESLRCKPVAITKLVWGGWAQGYATKTKALENQNGSGDHPGQSRDTNLHNTMVDGLL